MVWKKIKSFFEKPITEQDDHAVDFEHDNIIISVELKDEPYKNWFINLEIEDVKDSNISFSYVVKHVPKDITDEEIERCSNHLKEYISNYILDVLEQAAKLQEQIS